jgi:hypothetical protein
VRAKCDDEIGFIAACLIVRRGPRRQQALMQPGVLPGQNLQKPLIQPDQPIASRQIVKGKAEAETRNVRNNHRIRPLFMQEVADATGSLVRQPSCPLGQGATR